jgi:hypothetical protein
VGSFASPLNSEGVSGGSSRYGPTISATSKYCPQVIPKRCMKPFSERMDQGQYRGYSDQRLRWGDTWLRSDGKYILSDGRTRNKRWSFPECNQQKSQEKGFRHGSVETEGYAKKCQNWKATANFGDGTAAYQDWGAAKYYNLQSFTKKPGIRGYIGDKKVRTISHPGKYDYQPFDIWTRKGITASAAFANAENGVGYEKLTRCKPAGTCCVLLFGDAHDKCGRCCHGHQFEWVWNCGGSRKCA